MKSDSIRVFLTRHEHGVAFIAEIYGRLTGNPVSCLGTLGPGANMDRAPMLVLTGRGDSERLYKGSHQMMDVVCMFKPMTKCALSVPHSRSIPEIVRKAVRVSRLEKSGTCHIELPEGIAEAEVDAVPMVRVRRAVSDDKIMDDVFALIRQAKYPVIIAGNSCARK